MWEFKVHVSCAAEADKLDNQRLMGDEPCTLAFGTHAAYLSQCSLKSLGVEGVLGRLQPLNLCCPDHSANPCLSVTIQSQTVTVHELVWMAIEKCRPQPLQQCTKGR